MMQSEAFSTDWWDARREGSFFESVYRRGDDSIDGWLESRPMDLAARTARESAGAIWATQMTGDDRVLDCPCGLGRHTIALSSAGFDVTGVDLDPALPMMVPRRRQGTPRWARADMRALPFSNESFTVVLNLVLSFGFFADEADDRRVIREFARVLKPGGRLLLHTDINPDRVSKGTYGDREWRRLPGGATLRVSERFNSAVSRLEGTWRLISPSGDSEQVAGYSVRVYENDEIASMMTAAGFHVASLFGALDPGAPHLSPDAQEVVVLAIKR